MGTKIGGKQTGRKQPGEKRLGGETTWQGNGFGAENPKTSRNLFKLQNNILRKNLGHV